MRIGLAALVLVAAVSGKGLFSKSAPPQKSMVAEVPKVEVPMVSDPKDMDMDSTQRQAEASMQQVETDLKRLSTFTEEVRRSLDEADRSKTDVQHAIGYFRRQVELQQDERDNENTHIIRLEEEVATLQRHIKALEEEKAACLTDKATLKEANEKVLTQLNSMFQYGQCVCRACAPPLSHAALHAPPLASGRRRPAAVRHWPLLSALHRAVQNGLAFKGLAVNASA